MSDIDDLLRGDAFNKPSRRNTTIPAAVQQKKSVLLPATTHQRLKLIAAQEKLFIQDVILAALDDYEKKLEKRDARIERQNQEKWNERP